MKANSLLAEVRGAVDAYIAECLRERVRQAATIHPRYEQLWREIARVYQAGGKRMRPYLTVVGYGKLDEAIVPVAAAQELLHVAMLVHDDVIDQDVVRHSQPTINGAYEASYVSVLPGHYATHYANSAAVLAGDALLSEAYRMVQSAPFSPAVIRHISERLSQSVFEVIGGELLDVEAAFVVDETFDPMTIYRYKTASYSFVGPLLAGAMAAELDVSTRAVLQAFGEQCGIAFQLQDDLIGVFGDEAATGKSTDTDLREGKRTVLIAQHQAAMNAEQAARYEQWFGVHDAPSEALRQLKRDIEVSGARHKTEAITQRYFARSRAELAKLPPGFRRDELEQLVDRLQERRC
ncbi:MAG: polyprenyl synthetase family protein [Candidatus Saccharibacteria bacterium]|nr:polyprenyl synthetase family protein [Candidatus Saccharibacteria bacterium]